MGAWLGEWEGLSEARGASWTYTHLDVRFEKC